MEEMKERFRELTEKRDKLKEEQVELSGKLSVLKEREGALLKELKEKYNLNTLEEAETEVQRLSEEIERALAKAEESLSLDIKED
jgi:hypothetical protein